MNGKNNSYIELKPGDRHLPEIGIGILGCGFMGKVHSTGYIKVPSQTTWAPAIPKLLAICDSNEEKAREVGLRFGYQGYYTDWKDLVNDERIKIFDNCGPDDIHCEPIVAAAKNGKNVICEKPIAMNLPEARLMLDAVRSSGVKNMVCFEYRFIPAIQLAKYLIETGIIGQIYAFRGYYLQEPWYPGYHTKNKPSILRGLGCHIIDMARFLIGEVKTVIGLSKSFSELRADEENMAIFEFENGAAGTIGASGISTGRKNYFTWEVNGSLGSMTFDLEDLNHLKVYLDKDVLDKVKGFRNISVTESVHPLFEMAWAPGHNIAWENPHFYEIFKFIDAVINNKPVEPAATFEDGYKAQFLMHAIQESHLSGKRVYIDYGL